MKKLYIMHGWTYNLEKWQDLAKLLTGAGYEPVFLKVPGLTATTSKAWTICDYVTWLQGELAGAKEPIVLVGHSNGGRICMNYAAAHPEAVKHLVLIDAAGVYHNELPLRLKRLVFGTLARVGKKLTTSPALRRLLYKAAREGDYRTASPTMRQTMANMLASDKELKPATISVPTTIIWGSDDAVTPVKDARYLEGAIAGAKLCIVQGARHSPFATHPREVLAALQEAGL